MRPNLWCLVLAVAVLPAFAQEGDPQAPFITTPADVVERMLELAGTGPQDLVVDLGSGDGRIVLAAARKFGARGHGIEIDRRLVEQSREAARNAGLGERVSFEQADVLRANISKASVVTVYLLPGLIHRLQPRFLEELKPGTRIVSHAFTMVSWQPDRVETFRLSQRHPGQGDESRLFLWIVPAEARGSWKGADAQLTIHQNFQDIEIDGTLAGRALSGVKARLSGYALSWEAPGLQFRGRVDGPRIAGELAVDGLRRPFELVRAR